MPRRPPLHNTALPEPAQQCAQETLEELDWCLDQLEAIQLHRSVSEMASSKVGFVLKKFILSVIVRFYFNNLRFLPSTIKPHNFLHIYIFPFNFKINSLFITKSYNQNHSSLLIPPILYSYAPIFAKRKFMIIFVSISRKWSRTFKCEIKLNLLINSLIHWPLI